MARIVTKPDGTHICSVCNSEITNNIEVMYQVRQWANGQLRFINGNPYTEVGNIIEEEVDGTYYRCGNCHTDLEM